MRQVHIKRDEEVELIEQSGEILSMMLGAIKNEIRPGMTLLSLDKIAETFIYDNGGIPACKGYYGYPATLCLSVNNTVVHGVPTKYELKDGDILSVDSGVVYKGYYSDSAYTFEVGTVEDNVKKLLKTTKDSLSLAINVAIAGNRTGDIGHAIEQNVKKNGFFVVRDYSGHGVGLDFHEKPTVYNYGRRGTGSLLKENMVLAIEPIVNEISGDITCLDDGWTVVTAEGGLSAHYENTILVRKGHAKLLSSFKYCEDCA